uniref:Leucine rich immune protein (Coil-less) n=1 Tax=Anopheles atroparvus TaxID=41427 RepID=A0A182JDB3_ANOAO
MLFNLALLANLRQLESVVFVDNQITSIHPPQAAVVQNISALDLSHNQLRYLNMTALASLKQLRILLITNNQLAAVGYGLRGVVAFPRLQTLDLSNNVLQSFSLEQLSAPSLEYLQLSFNELSTVPGPLESFPKLTILALNHNALVSVSFALFEGLHDLVSLELSQNRLQTLDATRALELPRLESLMLSANQLQIVDLQKLTVPRLRTLDLSFNLLNYVPVVFENSMKSLQLVTVMGNPLTCATLQAHRAYIRKEILIPKWLLSDKELCSTGRVFVLNVKRRSCCTL